MRSADFFASLGLFVQPGFLDPTTCVRIHQEARVAPGIPGTIYKDGTGEFLDERKRRTLVVQLSDHTLGAIDTRLQAIRPHLEAHFNVSLTRHESPKVLCYRQGDFFGPHFDTTTNEEASWEIRTRRVAAVLFISDPQEYSGGSLVLYGLVDHGPWRSRGFRVESRPGLFMAYQPTLLHEVEPVLEGERISIVTFFA